MQIVFSKRNSFVSWLIRFMTSSNVSHVSIHFTGVESNWMVDSTGQGVKPGWWNYFKSKNTIVKTFGIINIEKELLENVVDNALDKMVGRKYDYFSLLGFGISIIVYKIFRKKIKNIFGSSKLYFCSEFILRVSKTIEEQTKVKIYEGNFELTSPNDLLKQSFDNKYLNIESKK